MTPVSFLLALAALSIGTYAMRFAGVKLGAALATKGKRRQPATTSAGPVDTVGPDDTAGPGDTAVVPEGDSTAAVTKWMDRATVVLIAAVFATTAIFDGQDITDPARLIGVGGGVLAAILRVPMLICVVLGMGICAGIRMSGIL